MALQIKILPDQRLELLRAAAADVRDDETIAVNHKNHRNANHAKSCNRVLFRVEKLRPLNLVLLQYVQNLLPILLSIESNADSLETLAVILIIKLLRPGHVVDANGARDRPNVDHHDLAAQLPHIDLASIESGKMQVQRFLGVLRNPLLT